MSTQLEWTGDLTSEPAEVPSESRTATPPLIVIRPPSGWQLINISELWRFRELIGFLVWRDVKVRYKQTALGAAWAVLQPLMMMVVFTVFFGKMAGMSSGEVPYPLFAYAGLLPWTFFATSIANAGNSVVGSERLITKIYFPRLAIPFAAVGAAVVDFVIALGLLIAMMIYYGVTPGIGVLAVPLVMGLILLVAMGVGTLLAAMNVAYRDFRYVIPFLIQLWMFATPTIYMQPPAASSRGGFLRTVLSLNPMTGLVGMFRTSALGGASDWGQLGMLALVAVASLLAGCLYFRQVEDSFSDII